MIRLAYEFLKYVKNSRGVEGLPLKYAIIILVAAVVIAIAIGMVTVLKGGIGNVTAEINESLVSEVNKSLSGI
jgi:hypothetical protein